MSVENRKEYQVDPSVLTQFPLLVLAYRKSEFQHNGVPADLIEIMDSHTVPPLILQKGSYEIIVKDTTYKLI
ncbi:hypothetical protein RZS08_31630, partial [Arthrospira platensis SPKY1]|nr:hypothetical protein [Arthrospira platensis SPKY1]